MAKSGKETRKNKNRFQVIWLFISSEKDAVEKLYQLHPSQKSNRPVSTNKGREKGEKDRQAWKNGNAAKKIEKEAHNDSCE